MCACGKKPCACGIGDNNMTAMEIAEYLENNCAFRDYELHSASLFRKLTIQGMHILRPFEFELDDALSVFNRDGYGTIHIYVDDPICNWCSESMPKDTIEIFCDPCKNTLHIASNYMPEPNAPINSAVQPKLRLIQGGKQ